MSTIFLPSRSKENGNQARFLLRVNRSLFNILREVDTKDASGAWSHSKRLLEFPRLFRMTATGVWAIPNGRNGPGQSQLPDAVALSHDRCQQNIPFNSSHWRRAQSRTADRHVTANSLQASQGDW